MNKLILILGDLAVGKSTLAKRLSNYYKIPYYTKDKLKEDLADIIGFNNRLENKKLSISAVKMMEDIFINYSITNNDLILEANFHYYELLYLKDLSNKYNYLLIPINITGDIELLFNKFIYRMENESRHKAHLTDDIITFNNYKEYILKSREEIKDFTTYNLTFTNDYDYIYNESIKIINNL